MPINLEGIPEGCKEEYSHPNFVLRDRESRSRSEMRFYNPKRRNVCQIKIDGCVIQQQTACDYVVITLDNGQEYYVELKGTDFDHAVEQLKATIQQLNPALNSPKISFIISTRSPKKTPKIDLLVKKLKKTYNIELIIQNSPGEFTL